MDGFPQVRNWGVLPDFGYIARLRTLPERISFIEEKRIAAQEAMIVSTDYSDIKIIREFENSTIHSALGKRDRKPVVLKIFKRRISADRIADLEKRLSTAGSLLKSIFPESLQTFVSEGRLGLLFDDADSLPFSVLMKDAKISVADFLGYAVGLAKVLEQLHRKRFVHFDLRPHNILFNRSTGLFSLFGWDVRKLPVPSGTDPRPDNLDEDRFYYTSPEQTGRLNLAVDHRSDLYALGAIYYRMLCGRAPFHSDDVSVRIHSHIARRPKRIQGIPAVLNGIVMKLLAKNAEDRYQSASGLRYDLEVCRRKQEKGEKIGPFVLGKRDSFGSFRVPTKLYGAEENVSTLIESFDCVCTGSVELVLVKGPPGMGKTSLVRQLQERVRAKNGLIAQCKSEKEYKDTPFYSLVGAFQALARQILTGDEATILQWKKRFLAHFGQNGRLIVDFIPEIEIIIGRQPEVPDLAPDEAQNRLNYMFKKFLQAFTYDGRPLVVFLDSFQWADYASIQLIQACLGDLDSRYLLLILGFRERGFVHANTMALAVEEAKRSEILVREIDVRPLTEENICQLIEEALDCRQNYRSLAKIILDKTNGNPFFVKQLLKTFYDRGLLEFEVASGCWEWDPKQIRRAEISENVVDLMVEKIMDLHPESIRILKIAACIGNRFDVQTLGDASEMEKEVVERLLKNPLDVGLIVREEEASEWADTSGKAGGTTEGIADYRFLHGRVHQAAYKMLTPEEKAREHLMLGQLLLRNFPDEEIESHVFKLVNHINLGVSLMTDVGDRVELARLNLRAGEISQSSSAYESAWKYFTLGTGLLTEKSWETDYELTKLLYLKRTECEYYGGSEKTASPLFDLLLGHVRTNEERVEVIGLKLNLFIKNDRLKEAVDIGIAALQSLFGERIPPNDAEITIVAQVKMQETYGSLGLAKIKSLAFLPEMTETDVVAMMKLLTDIIPAAYYTRRNLWILLTLKMIELSIHYGNNSSSAFGYMNYAVLLCSGLEDYNAGHAVGRLALDIKNKFENTALDSRLNFLFASHISHLKDSAKYSLQYLNVSYQTGIKYGDFVSAANSINFLLKTRLIVGSTLDEIRNERKKYQDFVDQFNNPDLRNAIEISKLLEILQNAEPPEERDRSLERLTDSELPAALRQSKNHLPLQWYYLVNAQIHLLLGKFEKALELIHESDKLIAGYSQLAVPEHYFYFSLIIAANYFDFGEEDKIRYWDILKNNRLKLEKLADSCPVNFLDKYKIVSAQMTAISGNFIETMNLFDEAIEAAAKSGAVQNEAIANELAARYFLARGKRTIAAAYLRSAAIAYSKWGATAKLQSLEFDYPDLLSRRYMMELDPSGDRPERNVSANAAGFDEIVRAFQSLSGELVLDRLLIEVLSVVMKHAGAQSGYVLIESQGHLSIAAEGRADSDPPVQSRSIPLEEFDGIATGIVYYVIRTRKYVLLDDADDLGIFAYDPHVNRNGSKSILCVPILSHDKLTGIVYLENDSTKGTFSEENLETILLLMSQVAIAVDNSLLYTNLSKITERLTTEKMQLEERLRESAEIPLGHHFSL